MLNELERPEGLDGVENADEFIRFWIDDNNEFVSLRIGSLGLGEAAQWGMMLADLSIHIVRALRQDGATQSEEVLRREIEQGYLGRLDAKGAAYSGSLLGTRQ